MARVRGWRRSGCYVWRTRKPHAMLGLGMRFLVPGAIGVAWWLWLLGADFWWLAFLLPFFSGRHTAYVGETGNRFFRDRQHLFGDGRYGTAGKPWADLDPKAYPLFCLFPGNEVARKIQEKLWIWMLLPVYNVEWNTRNPRRIKPAQAQTQRWARDAGGIRRRAPQALRVALYGVLVVGAMWSGWDKWVA
jgi:hypothetical protein